MKNLLNYNNQDPKVCNHITMQKPLSMLRVGIINKINKYKYF